MGEPQVNPQRITLPKWQSESECLGITNSSCVMFKMLSCPHCFLQIYFGLTSVKLPQWIVSMSINRLLKLKSGLLKLGIWDLQQILIMHIVLSRIKSSKDVAKLFSVASTK